MLACEDLDMPPKELYQVQKASERRKRSTFISSISFIAVINISLSKKSKKEAKEAYFSQDQQN